MIDDALIAQAAAVLKAGGLLGLPTETVYGLAADAGSSQAIARIYAAKGRPNDHPVIVHLAHVEQIRDWAIDIPGEAWTLARAFWPGPMTLILKRAAHVLDAVTGGQDTVGLRIPSHPVAHAVLAAFGGGVAAPSANKFGRVSPTTAQHVRDEFGDAVDLVLDGGASEVGIESTIIDCSSPALRVLRPGAITEAMIADALGIGGKPVAGQQAAAPRVSGSLDAHYAPRTRLLLVAPEALAATLAAQQARRVAVLSRERPAGFGDEWRQAAADACVYARELYAHLRELDGVGADVMLIEAPPQRSEWDGVNDRLRRAAFGSGVD
ncbi:MAG: threonylcarbamoyl-AMP synthase [Betaproteobacteria bacterium]|nr:threonylcarbamoyl-AMP synthase [Betaproteobacteria bacterium]